MVPKSALTFGAAASIIVVGSGYSATPAQFVSYGQAQDDAAFRDVQQGSDDEGSTMEASSRVAVESRYALSRKYFSRAVSFLCGSAALSGFGMLVEAKYAGPMSAIALVASLVHFSLWLDRYGQERKEG